MTAQHAHPVPAAKVRPNGTVLLASEMVAGGPTLVAAPLMPEEQHQQDQKHDGDREGVQDVRRG